MPSPFSRSSSAPSSERSSEAHDSTTEQAIAANIFDFEHGNNDWHRAVEAGNDASNPISDRVLAPMQIHDPDAENGNEPAANNRNSNPRSDVVDQKPSSHDREDQKPRVEAEPEKPEQPHDEEVFYRRPSELSPEFAELSDRLVRLLRDPARNPATAIQLMLDLRRLTR